MYPCQGPEGVDKSQVELLVSGTRVLNYALEGPKEPIEAY